MSDQVNTSTSSACPSSKCSRECPDRCRRCCTKWVCCTITWGIFVGFWIRCAPNSCSLSWSVLIWCSIFTCTILQLTRNVAFWLFILVVFETYNWCEMSVFDGPYHWCPDFTTCDKCQILTFHLVGVRNLQLAPYVGFLRSSCWSPDFTTWHPSVKFWLFILLMFEICSWPHMSVFSSWYAWSPDFTTCTQCQVLTFHFVGVQNLQLAPNVSFLRSSMLVSRFYSSREVSHFDSSFWWCLNFTTHTKCWIVTIACLGVQSLQFIIHVCFWQLLCWGLEFTIPTRCQILTAWTLGRDIICIWLSKFVVKHYHHLRHPFFQLLNNALPTLQI